MKSFPKIKKTILVILFLLCFIEIQNLLAQDQVNFREYLSQRFRHYCELVPREEVFVSTDREVYISGEELWFSAWLFDRQSFTSSSNGKIIYLELLNPENKPVAQKRIGINNGNGNGQINLSDTLTSGLYTLRAYTSWMKNFLPYNCFIKDIKIYNAKGSTTFKNKIYLNNNNKPVSGRNPDIVNSSQLLTLKTNNLKPDTLDIFVYADNKYLSDKNDHFYLFIQTHGIINHISSEKISSEKTRVSLPKSILLPGINQITVFNAKGKPVCENYIYTPAKSSTAISIESADNFAGRSKVSLLLNIPDSMPDGNSSTNFSLSVAPLINGEGCMRINEYLIFGSEFGLLPAKIIKDKKIDELPSEVIDTLLQSINSNWIDWNLVLSDNPPEFKFPSETEDHYFSGVLLTSDNQLAPPGEFVLLSIPGKIPLFKYSTTSYEAKFSFGLHIDNETHDLILQPDDAGKNFKIYLDSPFSDICFPSEIHIDPVVKPVPSYLSKMGHNYQVEKIYGSSSAAPSRFTGHSAANSKRFYGKPDAEVIMKDFVKLPGMEDVFFEIVPHIRLKKIDSAYEISLVDPFGKILYDSPPAMLIDGVVVKDPAVIVNLDPEQVEKIDVLKQQYMVGDYLFNGLVNVITTSGSYNNIPIPDNSIRLEYRIIDSSLVFISPDYSTPEMKSSRTPDFRNTLYWNPSVQPGKDGKIRVEFWSSDVASTYEINIQGIAGGKNVVSEKRYINIK